MGNRDYTTKVIYVPESDKQDWDEFKKVCSNDGVSVSAGINNLIKKRLEQKDENQKSNGKRRKKG